MSKPGIRQAVYVAGLAVNAISELHGSATLYCSNRNLLTMPSAHNALVAVKELPADSQPFRTIDCKALRARRAGFELACPPC
jgi:hypothetical protein